MRKSNIKLAIFSIIIFLVVILNSFILSILNYYSMIAFLIILIVLFKYLFGLDRDRHRYTKAVIMDIIIILLISFMLYYICGIFLGFVRTQMLYSFEGITKFILPFIVIVVLREILRYQMVSKLGYSKLYIVISCILLILLDLTLTVNSRQFTSSYQAFMTIAITILPSISENIVATYIANKTGYKPNILWLLVIDLYASLLPIVPKFGDYLGSVISLVFPFVICIDVYRFFEKRKKDIPLSYHKTGSWIGIAVSSVFVALIVYFTSGYFRFYTIAIATGSMTPNIIKGDVVLIDQKYDHKKLKIGQVIAYRYDEKIIVHRLVKLDKDGGKYYFYTKGDANNAIDNYPIYDDMIMGVVKIRFPYIGLPTIWINEL